VSAKFYAAALSQSRPRTADRTALPLTADGSQLTADRPSAPALWHLDLPRLSFGHWSLGFGWKLELGLWDLGADPVATCGNKRYKLVQARFSAISCLSDVDAPVAYQAGSKGTAPPGAPPIGANLTYLHLTVLCCITVTYVTTCLEKRQERRERW